MPRIWIASVRSRRDYARPHHPHQELAAGSAGRRTPASSTISRARRASAPPNSPRTIIDYFERHNKRAGGIKHELDPLPRVVLVPGLGLFGLGRSKKDAVIAADIAEAWVEGVSDAEAIGRFESISEADMFDCEYWPLEQAKLGKRQAKATAARRPDRRRHRRRPARSAPQPPRPSPRRARKSRCSTSICPRRVSRRKPSAPRRCRSNAT